MTLDRVQPLSMTSRRVSLYLNAPVPRFWTTCLAKNGSNGGMWYSGTPEIKKYKTNPHWSYVGITVFCESVGSNNLTRGETVGRIDVNSTSKWRSNIIEILVETDEILLQSKTQFRQTYGFDIVSTIALSLRCTREGRGFLALQHKPKQNA